MTTDAPGGTDALTTGIALGKLDQRVAVVEEFRREQIATNKRVADELAALTVELHTVATIVPVIGEMRDFMAQLKERLPEASDLTQWARGKKAAEDALAERQRKIAAQLRLHAVQQRGTVQAVQPFYLLALSIFVGALVNVIGVRLAVVWSVAGYSCAGALLVGSGLVYLIVRRRTAARLRALETSLGYPAPADDNSTGE